MPKAAKRDKGRMTVTVSLSITVDINDYALNYGEASREQIREDVRLAVNDAVNSGGVLAAGIIESRLR